MMKDTKLISFEISLPLPSISSSTPCPNCGYHIHSGTAFITKESLSKSIIILGCGTFLYFHYYHNEQLRSLLESIGDKIQSCTSSIIEFFQQTSFNNNNNTSKHAKYKHSTAKSHDKRLPTVLKPGPSSSTSIMMSTNQLNNCQVTNQIIYVDKPKNIEITVNKIDNLLEQVKELKESVQDFSITEHSFDRPSSYRLERRVSENDLPSLEWDLEDLLQADDTTMDDISQVFQHQQYDSISSIDQPLMLFNLEYNGIDAETLSKIVFNKNFDFKERICEKNRDNNQIHESWAQIRQRLLRNQILYRTLRNVPQVNALMEPPPYRLYKSCLRDSAYFED